MTLAWTTTLRLKCPVNDLERKYCWLGLGFNRRSDSRRAIAYLAGGAMARHSNRHAPGRHPSGHGRRPGTAIGAKYPARQPGFVGRRVYAPASGADHATSTDPDHGSLRLRTLQYQARLAFCGYVAQIGSPMTFPQRRLDCCPAAHALRGGFFLRLICASRVPWIGRTQSGYPVG